MHINFDGSVILASRSPRRIELLKMIFDEFDVIPSNYDESRDTLPDCTSLVRRLAQMKAQSVLNSNENFQDSLIIGCDTLVCCKGQLLGIPQDRDSARQMLTLLSGNKHSVITGVCLAYKGEMHIFHSETRVKFYSLTDDEIEQYISSNEPYDKAGGYGIQSLGGLLAESIEGDYYNAVGLPIARLYREIKQLITK